MDKVGLSRKYQTYPEYIDIESIFIDSIPAHWQVKPLFILSGFRQGKAHEPFVDDDGKYICVNSRFVSTGGEKIKHCTVNLTPANLNDILMVMSDLPNGRALAKAFYVSDHKEYAVNQRVCALTAKSINSKFLYYQLDRSPYFLMFDDGSNQTHLSNEAYKKYPVLLPTVEEQQKIANFLDHETAKIDTLIEKQQQLIKLLKEKRQAVISHAVTKGLNPNAPMRDSGAEWLGEVPEHWAMPKISHIGKVLNGSTPDKTNFSYWDDGTIPWLASGCLNSEIVVEPSDYISIGAYQSCSVELIPANSLLVGMVGQGKTRGSSAILGIESCINQNMAAIIIGEKIKVKFIYFLFQAMYEDLRELGRGGNQAALNCEIISSVRIPLPPLYEQIAIVEMLDELLIKLNGLDKLAAAQIEILQERRTALISAAVTGKIDVRNWNGNAMECEI
jgi:type I restriction enzyme S subunit